MASGENENPQRDQLPGSDEAEGTTPEQFEATEAWTEPTDQTDEAPEPTEALPGQPEPTIAFEGSPTDTEGGEPGEGVPLEPTPEQAAGVAETVAFESLTPEALEGLMGGASEAVPSDVAWAEGESPEGAPGEAATAEAQGEATDAAAAGAETPEGLPGEGLSSETGVAEGEPGAEGESKAEEEAEKAEEEEGEKQPGVLARLGTWIADTSVYNMLLLVALVALILGSLALVEELKRYNWDFKAREGKRPIAAAGADYAPPSTTAIA